MKTTRNLKIKERISPLSDIQRIANSIGVQYANAKNDVFIQVHHSF
jgi:hypothetical protein